MEELETESVEASYDEKGDVLYITLKDSPGVANHVSDNILVRENPDSGEIVGITVENYRAVSEI